jgi:hypothetical protein
MEAYVLWVFPTFYCFLLGPGPVQMASAQVLPSPESGQLEVKFPCAPEDDPGRYYSVVGHMRWYERVCELFLCFSTCTSQPGSSAQKEGDDVTALSSNVRLGLPKGHVTCPVPGNRQHYIDIATET